MDRFWEMADISRLQGIGDLLREPRGLFAIGAVVVLVIYGLSVGRTKALVSLLSIYVAYVLTVLFPFQSWLESRVPVAEQVGLPLILFFILYVLAFWIFSRSLARSRQSRGDISLVQVLLISAIQIGLFASIGVSLLPPELGSELFGPAQPYVSGPHSLWIWAASSLALLPWLKSKRR